MTLASRSFRRAVLLTAAVAAIFAFGCKKPPKAPPPVTAPPPPPPAAPTVTLSANPSSIASGDSSTLSWTSTNATSVSIAPGVGTVVAEGNTRVTPSDSTTYTITATGPGGTANANTRVTVAAPPPPQPKAGPTPDEIWLKEVQDAYFDFNKADLRSDAREALSHTANYLRNYPQVKVTIEGHCDERGSTEYNLGLGDRRANATKNYLVSLGISADRINTVSYGKEKPFCMESNEDCWQRNRRGHFVKAN